MKRWIHGMAAFGLIVLFGERAAAGTITGSNQSGWQTLSTDDTGNPGGTGVESFVSGPGTPPAGVGSLNLSTAAGGGDGSAQVFNSSYAGVSVASLTALSYSTYDTVNNGQQFPFLQLGVLTDPAHPEDPDNYDIWTFEPPYQTQATVMDQWQTWNTLTGGWYGWTVGGPGSNVVPLSTLEAAFPNAVLVGVTDPSLLGFPLAGITLAVGYASPGDVFNGNVDNFTIGTADGTTTYDFEPSAAAPEPATCTMLGMGILSLAGYRWRRKQTAA